MTVSACRHPHDGDNDAARIDVFSLPVDDLVTDPREPSRSPPCCERVGTPVHTADTVRDTVAVPVPPCGFAQTHDTCGETVAVSVPPCGSALVEGVAPNQCNRRVCTVWWFRRG